MSPLPNKRNQSGFSLIELLIALGMMLTVTASVVSLCKDSFRLGMTAGEMTDAQQNLRTAQEYINRDLITAGDGMRGLNNTCVRLAFVSNYLTKNPGNNPCVANGTIVNLPLIQSDNNVPAGTVLLGAVPAANVRSIPTLSDRIVILQRDSNFASIPVAAGAITNNGLNIRVTAADFARVNPGEIYFITSSQGSTFGTITGLGANTLNFAAGDLYGLNQPGANGPIDLVSPGGAQAATIMRMHIITYVVTDTGLLLRRNFGIAGAGFTDSVIAENVRNIQYRYILGPDAAGLIPQPASQLVTPDQQSAVRQVEVTITTQTVHPDLKGNFQNITMTTTTGVRNLQFLESLEP